MKGVKPTMTYHKHHVPGQNHHGNWHLLLPALVHGRQIGPLSLPAFADPRLFLLVPLVCGLLGSHLGDGSFGISMPIMNLFYDISSWCVMIPYMHIYAHCTSMSRNKKCPGRICLLELKRDETDGIAKQVHSKARDLRVHASYPVTGAQSFNTISGRVWKWSIPPWLALLVGNMVINHQIMGYLWGTYGYLIFRKTHSLAPAMSVNLSQLWGGNSPKSSAEEQREKKIPWCTWCRQSNSQTRGCRPTTNPSRRKWKNLR